MAKKKELKNGQAPDGLKPTLISIEESNPESIVKEWWHQHSEHSVEINEEFNSICFNFNLITPEQAIDYINKHYLQGE